jgi:metalloendopeptidase OMA1, mitochondrial
MTTRTRAVGREPHRWIALVAAALAIAVACQTAPITGRSQLIALSQSQETQMGLQAYSEVLKKSHVSTDPALNAQVDRVGRRIAAATGRADYQWEFKVIEDKQVNAFCLPGGKVAVYTGILPVTRDDAGLAAVLGHEAAHATARHGAERMTQALGAQLVLAAAQIGLGVMSSQDPQTAQRMVALLGAPVAQVGLLAWGRTQESEADRVGLIYMAKAGYEPRAARDLWVRMAEASQGRQRPPEFLSTHPSEATRIRQIEGWIPEAMKYYQPR